MNYTLGGASQRAMQNIPETRASARTAILYGTVTITGAAVMILELLGTRIIGPLSGMRGTKSGT